MEGSILGSIDDAMRDDDDQSVAADSTSVTLGSAQAEPPDAPEDAAMLQSIDTAVDADPADRQAIDLNLTTPAPEARRALSLSQQTGVPVDVATDAPEETERLRMLQSIDDATSDAPVSRGIVTDPDLGPYVTDDIDYIVDMERLADPRYAEAEASQGPGGFTDNDLVRGVRALGRAAYRSGLRIDSGDKAAAVEIHAQNLQDQSRSFGEIWEDQRSTHTQDDFVNVPGLDDITITAYRWMRARLTNEISDPEADALEAVAASKRAEARFAAVPKSQTADRAMKEWTHATQTNGWAGAFDYMADNPMGIAALAIETAFEFAVPLAAVTAGSVLTGGVGAPAMMGAASFFTERYQNPAEFFKEKGFDTSKPEDVLRILQDPEVMQELKDQRFTKASIVGAFDALTMGLAGKVFGGQLTNMASQLAIQMAGGGGGEFLGEYAATGKINPTEILLEMIAEMVTTPVDIAIMGIDEVGSKREKKRVEKEQTEAAVAYKDRLTEIVDRSGKTKLMTEAPELFQQVIERLTGSTDMAEINFNPAGIEAFVTAMEQPEAAKVFYDTLGLDVADLNEARVLGLDLTVPIDSYIKALTQQGEISEDLRNAVISNTRAELGAATFAEAEVALNDMEASAAGRAAAAEAQAEVDAAAAPEAEPPTEAAQIEDSVDTLMKDITDEAAVTGADRTRTRALLTAVREAVRTEINSRTAEGKGADDLLSSVRARNLTPTVRQTTAPEMADPAELDQQAAEFGVDPATLAAELKAAGGDITLTPLFKAWFEGSEVALDDGTPMVVYHGTNTTFDAFEQSEGWYGDGTYFTADSRYASEFADDEGGNVMPVYLSMRNPYFFKPELSDVASNTQLAQELGFSADEVDAALTDYAFGHLIPNALMDLGYDGIIIQDPSTATEYVVFDGSQIKSTMNSGAFSPDSDNILEQAGSHMFGNPLPVEPTGGAKGKTVTIKDIGKAFDDNHQAVHGAQLTPETDEAHHAEVMKMARSELEAQMKRPNSGVGWYEQDVVDALVDTAQIFPTLLTDKSHRDLYLMFAGVFSNGMNPAQAWEASAVAFELFLQDGVIPTTRVPLKGEPQLWAEAFYDKKNKKQVPRRHVGWGVRNAGNTQQLTFMKFLVEREGGLQEAMDWMKNVQSPLDINNAMRESGAYKAKYPRFTKAEEGGAPTYGALAFGDKLGRYTVGLHGIDISAGDTTSDLWYTRTFRRWTGRMFEAPLGKEGVAAQPNNDAERDAVFRITGELAHEYDLKPGDVQAVLWFFEKRLWHEHGSALDEGTNSKGASNLLGKRGVQPAGDGAGSSGADTEADRQGGKLRQERIDFNERNKAADPGTLYQGAQDQTDPSLVNQRLDGPLGSFSPETLTINLFETADLSTLLHEGGHFFVEMLGRLAQLPNASTRTIENYNAMLRWAGARTAADLDVALYGDEARAKQERLAEAFEAYLKEGKAPSTALRRAFAQFRSWLLFVYESVTSQRRLGTEIDPEISAIFDKLLATDAQIEEMAVLNEFHTSSLSPEMRALMTPAEAAAHDALLAEADAIAAEDTAARSAVEEAKTQEQAYKKAFENNRASVEEQLWSRTDYAAFWYLTRGSHRDADTPSSMANRRLSKKQLLENHTAEELAALPKHRRNIFTDDAETATSPDQLANYLGFETASELLTVMTNLRDPATAIDEEAGMLTRTEMAEPEEAGADFETDRLYNEARLKAIDIELNALAKAAGRSAPSKAAVEQLVLNVLERTPLKDLLNPAKFIATAVREARSSAAAEAKGDHLKAFTHKRKQLMNHELARRSIAARKSTDTHIKYLRRFEKRNKWNNMDADYLEQIREITGAYRLRSDISDNKREAFNAEAFASWVKRAEAGDGAILIIPDEILEADSMPHWKTLTMNQFNALVSAVKNIDKQGRNAKQLIIESKRVDRELAVAHILSRMDRLPQTNRMARRAAGKEAWFDPALHALAWGDAGLLKMSFLLEMMDGAPEGPAQRAFYDPFAQAEMAENRMIYAFGKNFDAAFQGLPDASRRAFNQKKWVPELGHNMSRAQILHMAANTGNASNLQKMIEGSTKSRIDGSLVLTEEKVSAVLETLTAEEIAFVNQLWQMFEDQRDAVGDVWRKEHGEAPIWMDALEVELPNGTLTGGYIPMMYDPTDSAQGEQIENKTALEAMQSEQVKASVFSGMTKARTGFSAPVLLDLTRIPGKLQETAHFVTHYEAVRQADRLLANKDLENAIVNRFGPEYYSALQAWVGTVALGGKGGTIHRFDVLGKMVEHMRNNATVAIMGASATTMLTQPLGVFTSIDTLALGVDGKAKPGRGALAFAKGVLKAFDRDAWKQALEASSELRFRMENSDRDVRHAISKLRGMKGTKSEIQRFLLIGIPAVQFATVDMPTWLAAYNMGLKEALSQADAVAFADRTLGKTQGGGSPKDLAAAMSVRGSARAVTMFMTFFSTLYGIQRRLGNQREMSASYMYRLFVGSFTLYVLPSIIEGIFRLEAPDFDDEDYPEWLAMKVMLFAGSTVPVARDLVSGAFSKYGYSPTPLASIGESTANSVTELHKLIAGEKDMDAKTLQKAIALLGWWTGRIPSTQLNRVVKAFDKYDDEGGRDFNYWQFIVGPDKRDEEN